MKKACYQQKRRLDLIKKKLFFQKNNENHSKEYQFKPFKDRRS